MEILREIDDLEGELKRFRGEKDIAVTHTKISIDNMRMRRQQYHTWNMTRLNYRFAFMIKLATYLYLVKVPIKSRQIGL